MRRHFRSHGSLLILFVIMQHAVSYSIVLSMAMHAIIKSDITGKFKTVNTGFHMTRSAISREVTFNMKSVCRHKMTSKSKFIPVSVDRLILFAVKIDRVLRICLQTLSVCKLHQLFENYSDVKCRHQLSSESVFVMTYASVGIWGSRASWLDRQIHYKR